MLIPSRHVPGSQPLCYFNSNSDQYEKSMSFLQALSYYVYILLSHTNQFCRSLAKVSRKVSRILPGSRNSGSSIRDSFCPFSWDSKHFIKRKLPVMKDYNMDNQAQYSAVPWHIMLCHNRYLKIKRPRAWNMSDSKERKQRAKWSEISYITTKNASRNNNDLNQPWGDIMNSNKGKYGAISENIKNIACSEP